MAGVNNRTNCLNKFAADMRGAVSMIFGIMLVPLIVFAGVAVDLSRGLIVQQRLGQALDAAALAVGGARNLSESDKLKLANDYFQANYPVDEMGVPGTLSMHTTETTVYITATAELPTTLMGIAGFDKLTLRQETEVTRAEKGLEVVMVLDNTGSMRGSKIEDLKTASADLVNILFGDNATSDNLKIGLVPFAAAVNIGTDAVAQGWIDTQAKSSIAGENFNLLPNGKRANVYQAYDFVPNVAWNGCVETRPYPLDVKDTAPSGGNGDTLWVPYFAPDEPDSSNSYQNDYIDDDPASGTEAEIQMDWRKYLSKDRAGEGGPLYGCTVDPLTPLTNKKADLLDAIDDMGADGFTHIPIGMAWGWRVLSPGAPFTEGSNYDDATFDKAIILLTDGENTIRKQKTHNKSAYSAYGYVTKKRLGTTSRSKGVDEMNDRTAEVCDNAKTEGIRVYTITFKVDDDETRNLMRDCASSSSLYFDSPSGEQLRGVFQAIANDLSNLRISL